MPWSDIFLLTNDAVGVFQGNRSLRFLRVYLDGDSRPLHKGRQLAVLGMHGPAAKRE